MQREVVAGRSWELTLQHKLCNGAELANLGTAYVDVTSAAVCGGEPIGALRRGRCAGGDGKEPTVLAIDVRRVPDPRPYGVEHDRAGGIADGDGYLFHDGAVGSLLGALSLDQLPHALQ